MEGPTWNIWHVNIGNTFGPRPWAPVPGQHLGPKFGPPFSGPRGRCFVEERISYKVEWETPKVRWILGALQILWASPTSQTHLRKTGSQGFPIFPGSPHGPLAHSVVVPIGPLWEVANFCPTTVVGPIGSSLCHHHLQIQGPNRKSYLRVGVKATWLPGGPHVWAFALCCTHIGPNRFHSWSPSFPNPSPD